MKRCCTCKQLKDESTFCKDRSKKDNLHVRCRPCEKIVHYNGNKKHYHRQIWRAMKSRCYNPKNMKDYKNWGGRGIQICDEWLNDFEEFKKYVGERPTPKHTIDRIDNEGNYEPGNVKWSTRTEQNNNKRVYKKKKVKNAQLSD